MKKLFFLISCSFHIATSFAQTDQYSGSSTLSAHSKIPKSIPESIPGKYSSLGKFYAEAGFNWANYSNSDIRFRGTGYDFTLKNVDAVDQPNKGSIQYNFHLGYRINDRYSIYFGLDHMKYVLEVPQQVKISGFIESSVSSPAIASGQFEGVYNDQTITITPDFLTLEYTDGFNYLKLGAQRQDNIWVSEKGKSALMLSAGLAGGIITPRSDVRLFKVGENNKLNLAGWAASANAGLKFYINKKWYLQGSFEGGYSDLYHVYTTGRNDIDKASQHFNFLQNYWLLGFQF